MEIGKMDRRISLQQFVNKAWITQVSVWAEFKKPSLKVLEVAGNIGSELIREISIRRNDNVRKGWRVIWNSKTFEVQHTYELTPSNTILVCRELVT